jgi:hypothetical protein
MNASVFRFPGRTKIFTQREESTDSKYKLYEYLCQPGNMPKNNDGYFYEPEITDSHQVRHENLVDKATRLPPQKSNA